MLSSVVAKRAAKLLPHSVAFFWQKFFFSILIMLSKRYRLRNKRDFDRVYRQGRHLTIGCFSVSYLISKNEASRLGFVVGKKINQKASRRNYLKRLMRVAFADLPGKLNMSYDIVVGLSRDPVAGSQLSSPFVQFKGSAQETLRKINGC